MEDKNMRCIVCQITEAGSKEHIVPEMLGNKNFVTYSLCEDCNQTLGRTVDCHLKENYFVNKIRNDLGEDVPLFHDTFESEGKKYRTDGKSIDFVPGENKRCDSILQVEATNFKEGLKAARKNLLRDGLSPDEVNSLLANAKETEVTKEVEYHGTVPVDKGRFLLACVKMAYEFAFEVLGEAYLNDPVAEIIRKILRIGMEDKDGALPVIIENLCVYQSPIAMVVLEKVEQMTAVTELGPKHLCILHEEHGNLFCHILLYRNETIATTVCLSVDGQRYFQKGTVKVVVIQENRQHKVLEMNFS